MPRSVRALLAGPLVLILGGSLTSIASAEPDPEYWEKLTTAEQHALVNFYYLGAAQEVPYPEQEEEGYDILLNVANPLPFEGTSPVEVEIERVRGAYTKWKADELRRHEELAPGNPQAIVKNLAVLAGGAAGAKYVSGGANPMLTEIETGFVGSDGGEGDFCYSKECSGQLIWYKEGYDIYGGAIMTQSPGAFLFFGLKDYKPWYGPVFWFLKPCDENTYTAPASASLSAAVYATEAKCWLGYDEDIHLQYPYLTWPDIDALSRRIPYDGESPYDYYLPPVEEAPLLGDVEEAIKDEVNGDEKIQESDRHEKHPERFPDPVIPKTATKVDHSCDRTPGPIYENPFGGGEPFDRKKETPFYVKNREGFEDAVYLHWGQTRWEPALEGWSGERRTLMNGMGSATLIPWPYTAGARST